MAFFVLGKFSAPGWTSRQNKGPPRGRRGEAPPTWEASHRLIPRFLVGSYLHKLEPADTVGDKHICLKVISIGGPSYNLGLWALSCLPMPYTSYIEGPLQQIRTRLCSTWYDFVILPNANFSVGKSCKLAFGLATARFFLPPWKQTLTRISQVIKRLYEFFLRCPFDFHNVVCLPVFLIGESVSGRCVCGKSLT